jgi:hypothetical protein
VADLIWLLFLGSAVVRMTLSFVVPDPVLASSYRIEAGIWFLIALVWKRREG